MNTQVYLNLNAEQSINDKIFINESGSYLSFTTCSQCGGECDTKTEIGESVVGVTCSGNPRYETGPVIVSECCGALCRDEEGNEVTYEG